MYYSVDTCGSRPELVVIHKSGHFAENV